MNENGLLGSSAPHYSHTVVSNDPVLASDSDNRRSLGLVYPIQPGHQFSIPLELR